ncbi:S-layer homology domain-containing protein [Paenibacillus glycanilyticus]|uniref:S-layer homology domain-containing protein n=1 Tax=Paenibacillus glycanilyticus TaxID=126569 RepID=UPI00203A9FE4|nr:S-layer homology domain-containing protein [Paenibacillus glycanilyticus]MCM3629825.1 S-layer homology domain-containing protein [Paenibacillus glycanilyticus]
MIHTKRRSALRKIQFVCLSLLLTSSILLGGFSFAADVAYAAPSYTLSVSNNEPVTGREVRVQVIGQELSDVYATELQATFDTDHLRFKSASSDRFDYAVAPAVKGSQIVLAFTKVGPISGESGTVVLAEMVFEATALGSGTVELKKVKTVDSAMNVADHDANAIASLKVVAAPNDPGPGTNPGSNGGSGGDTPAVITEEGGKIVIKPTPKVDGSTGRVAWKIDESTWLKAVAKATAAGGGLKKIQLALTAVPDSTSHALELPAVAFSASAEVVQIEISTPLSTVTVPSNMFLGGKLSSGDIEFLIQEANIGGLDEKLRAKIGDRPVIDLSVRSGGQEISWSNPNAPATISIPYSPTAEEKANPEHITVWSIDGQGNAIAVPSGRYDAATGSVLLQATHFGKFAVVFVQKTFDDLGKFAWANSAIEVMASKGIVSGVSATEYRPGASVSRADFALLLVRTMGLQGAKGEAFSDVSDNAYYAEAVAVLRGMGIATGTGDNLFRPNDAISRQDMMVLIAKALSYVKKAVPAPAEPLSGFTDAGSIAGYAKDSVAGLIHAGLVTGANQSINPNAWTTRAETAVLMHRLYNYFYK